MSVEVLMADSGMVMESLGEESAIFKCKHCDNTFMKHKALKKHMKKSHFRVESVEEEEEELLLEKSKAKFECNYCDNTFKKERNLNLHIREDHEDEDLDDESVKFDIKVPKVKKNSYECPECGIDYHIESELKRHMDLRHTTEQNTVDDGSNNEELSLEEKLLAQDDDGESSSVAEEMGSLDEVVADSSVVENQEVELDGQSLSMEDIDFDLDQLNQSSENDTSDNFVENSEVQDEIVIESSVEEQPVVFQESESEEFVFSEHETDAQLNESVEVELPVDNVTPEESMEFELDGESIVMDDAAFDMLESAMQMTMSTPDDSDEEEDVALSSRKRKNTSKVTKKKRGRPSKKSKDEGEILLDGEAVVEDLDSSATDDEDIVVVDEVNIVQNQESGSEESEPEEDDDPDFSPNQSLSKKESSKRNSRSSRTSNRNKNVKSSVEPVQITPVIKEKALGRGRTRISVVPEASDVPIIKSIPRSTRIVFNPGNAKVSKSDESASKRSSKVNGENQLTKKLLCSLCKNIFTSREDFNVHMLDHKKPHQNSSPQSIKKIHCGKCSKSFLKKTLLDDHMKSEHCYKCAKCRQKFDSKDSLNGHMKTHLVKCDKCNFTGESKQKVLDHKKVAHNFKCSKCRQAFDQKDKLEGHVKANHFFKCGKCNVSFDAKNLMEEHNKKFHYFPCPVVSCGKVFDMRQRLAAHDKASHQSCDVCEDDFSWPEPGHSCYYTKNNIKPVLKW